MILNPYESPREVSREPTALEPRPPLSAGQIVRRFIIGTLLGLAAGPLFLFVITVAASMAGNTDASWVFIDWTPAAVGCGSAAGWCTALALCIYEAYPRPAKDGFGS